MSRRGTARSAGEPRRMMIGTRPRVTRLVIAALLVLPALVASVSPSLAAPSKQDVEAAHQKLLAAQDQFAAVNEQYNQAVYELQQAQQHLDETLAMKKAAAQQAATARDALSKRAVQAYTDMRSQYESLLSAGSLSQLSDRRECRGASTQTDADLASQADAAAQQAAWASQEYDQAVADHQQKADQLQQQKQAAENALAQAQQYASQTASDYNSWVQAQQQALQQAASTPAPTTSSSPSPPPSSGGDGNFNPPPASGAGATAAAAAESVVGAPY